MSRGRGEPLLSDGGLLLLLLAAGSGAALLWLWGGVAGVVFGRGWPSVALPELPWVALRLPAHLGDPKLAWPAAARARLPDAMPLYSTLLALAGSGITAARRLVRGRFSRPGWRAGAARWARSRELDLLGQAPHARDAGARLVLGRRGRRLLHAEHRHALVAFGPPQSGKSAGLAVPALLEWRGPAVASSIKTDLLGCTEARRRRLGEVLVFDPFELCGRPGHTWSPLRSAGTWDGALAVAARMAGAGELDQRGVEGGDFWTIAAEQRLAPLLYTAAATGAEMTDVVRWAYGQGARDLEARLGQIVAAARDPGAGADARAAFDAVRAFEVQADRTRSSIEATAQAILRAYRFSVVARSAAGAEITAERLLDSSATLYLIGDAKASKLLRPIFLALLQEIVDAAYERATRNGGALPRPLLLCLDEAGNVAPLPNLAEIASTAPSHNIQLVTIFHDLAQARARYRGQAETVVNSHRARMLLPGVADLETLRLFSSLIGEEEARELTRTSGSGGISRSTGTRRRPLVAPEMLRQLPDGQALLLYGRLPPVVVRQRRWFEDRALRRLAEAR